jgi:hypothetical protein
MYCFFSPSSHIPLNVVPAYSHFFFPLRYNLAQLNFLVNLGANWEEIGRKKYKQKQRNLSIHEIDGGSCYE